MEITTDCSKIPFKRLISLVAGWSFVALLGVWLYVKITSLVVQSGFLFGWLIGASKTPVAGVAIPLVYGLLGTAVFASLAKVFAVLTSDWESRSAMRKAALAIVASWMIVHFATWFVYHTKVGITEGALVLKRAAEQEPAKVPNSDR